MPHAVTFLTCVLLTPGSNLGLNIDAPSSFRVDTLRNLAQHHSRDLPHPPFHYLSSNNLTLYTKLVSESIYIYIYIYIYLSRRKLRMTSTNITRKRSLTIPRLYLLTHRTKPILWIITFTHTWSVAVVILFLTTATACIGYVLPWGQISLWGATVIKKKKKKLSAFKYVGKKIVQWVWGGVRGR